MAIEVLPVTQPVDPPYLEHRFQDWLADPRIGLMRRNRWARKFLQKDLPNLRHPRAGEATRTEQLLQFLLSQEGYLVSTLSVARVLYNGYAGPCEISDVDQICHRLRGRLLYPELLYRRAGIGMGVGIEDFSLKLFELRLLYPLWRKREDWVSLDELGQGVYNSTDSSIFGAAIKTTIYRLRKPLSEGSAMIETRRDSPYQEGAYRLVES